MSDLGVFVILGAIIVTLVILIVVCLGVADWAQGFTPNKDPNHSRHRSKKDEIPTGD